MAHANWGQGGGAEAHTGILDVLLAYVSQGGDLYGARRWKDNPLTLTHVRWQGASGAVLDAFREPGGSVAVDDVESRVWVQLALKFPNAQPGAAGAEAPWAQLAIDPATASQWVMELRQSYSQRRPRPAPMRDPALPGLGAQGPLDGGNPWFRPGDPGSGGGSGFDAPSPYGKSSLGTSFDHEPSPAIPLAETQHIVRDARGLPDIDAPSPPYDRQDSSQWTGEFQRPAKDAGEIAVLPCIEVELPPLLENRTAVDYHRDFARDVAVHFRQAVEQFPEVREVRGWMRGERLVLAARYILRTGTRIPRQSDMEQVVKRVMDALTERTLPYDYLGFADPGEWMQGRPLPES